MTEVQICNIALTGLGASRITSLTQDSENARRCNVLYATLRDDLLRRHPWNFAVTRRQLAVLDETPAFGYTYVYQLPADCLRVLSEQNSDTDYKIEGRKVFTDDTTIKIKYIARVTDTNIFSIDFSMALAAYLASTLAYSITNSNTVAEAASNTFNEKLSLAKAADASEGLPDDLETETWTNAR